jgi:hypothetical protein
MIDPSSSPVPACPQRAQLLKRIVEIEALVRDLQERLERNSSNFSIPPSANPLDAPKPVVKAPSGRNITDFCDSACKLLRTWLRMHAAA